MNTKENEYTFSIVDVLGRQIYYSKANPEAMTTHLLDLSEALPGLYTLKIIGENTVESFSLIKE